MSKIPYFSPYELKTKQGIRLKFCLYAPEVEAILDTETTHVEAILDQETTHKKVRGPEEDKEVCEAAEVLLNAQEAPQEEVEGGNPEPEKRRVEGVEDKYLEYVQGWFTFMSFLE